MSSTLTSSAPHSLGPCITSSWAILSQMELACGVAEQHAMRDGVEDGGCHKSSSCSINAPHVWESGCDLGNFARVNGFGDVFR